MRTITIGNAPSLTKDHYENEMELKIELQVAQNANDIDLTDEEKAMLKEASEEAAKPDFKGLTTEELKASIQRNYA